MNASSINPRFYATINSLKVRELGPSTGFVFVRSTASSHTNSVAFISLLRNEDDGRTINSTDCGSSAPCQKLTGDFNGDGLVDNADLEIWTKTFGKIGEQLAADANGDGKVNGADYTIWADNFGNKAARRCGDFDSDGDVDSDDLKIWTDSFGVSGRHLAADANGDGIVNGADYTIWADNFDKI